MYGVPPPQLEEHGEAIYNLNDIFQGIHMQRCELEGLGQANEVLTSSNSSLMQQLLHMTVIMNNIQAQLKILQSATTNTTRTMRNFYCWTCGRNFTHESKTCLAKKRSTRNMNITRIKWAGEKRSTNDSLMQQLLPF